jgi:hypothetical protein
MDMRLPPALRPPASVPPRPCRAGSYSVQAHSDSLTPRAPPPPRPSLTATADRSALELRPRARCCRRFRGRQCLAQLPHSLHLEHLAVLCGDPRHSPTGRPSGRQIW